MAKPTPAERKRQKAIDEINYMSNGIRCKLNAIGNWIQTGEWEKLYKYTSDWSLADQCVKIQELAAGIVEAELDALEEEVTSASPWTEFEANTALCFEVMRLRKELANVAK